MDRVGGIRSSIGGGAIATAGGRERGLIGTGDHTSQGRMARIPIGFLDGPRDGLEFLFPCLRS